MWEYGLFHLFVILTSYYLFGVLYGVCFLIVFVLAADKALSAIGYYRLSFGDLSLAYEYPGALNNLAGYFIMEKVDYPTFKNHFYQRAVLRIPKLRSVLVSKLGVYFWKDVGPQAGEGQLVKSSKSIKTEQECLKHCEDIANTKMDYSKPLWKMSLVEDYSATESVVFVSLHHSFTDAGGFLSLISSVNDEGKNVKVDKTFPKVSIIIRLLTLLLGPLYCIYLSIDNGKMSTDNKAEAVNEIKGFNKRETRLYSAKRRVPFDQIRKCYKKLCTDRQRVSFNDYIMGVLSVSLGRWYKLHGVEGAQRLQAFCSVNMRPPPTKFEEISIENDSVGVKFAIPIKTDIMEAINDCRTNFHQFFNPFALLSYKAMGYIVGLVPEWIGRKIIYDILSNVEMVYSNVPFSSNPWYLCNKEVTKIGAFASIYYNWKVFFAAMTYRDELRLTISANAQLKMDPQLLLDNILDFIEDDIRQIETVNGHLKTE
ncbi:unnamed protein product [Moneuplotes crassus]|uniref:Diacylglycerol O-acyltransferase n=1 Tax=Euplotes crassus TaxID=5936 RepID=A0AAD1UIF3_EUPCR|nr:unnamed protein product [Moneuplotes crassus]